MALGDEDREGSDRCAGFAAGLDALHHLDGGNEGDGGEVFERATFGVEAFFQPDPLRFEGSEHLLDGPAPTIEVDHGPGIIKRGDRMRGLERRQSKAVCPAGGVGSDTSRRVSAAVRGRLRKRPYAPQDKDVCAR